MSNDITPFMNEFNIENVRAQIAAKKASHSPYYSTSAQALGVVTDHDTFPYPRYFRGVPGSHIPVVAEREAGWRHRNDSCYHVKPPPDIAVSAYPNNCFQAPCSTVYPCYPEYLAKYSDKEAMDLILNKTCIVQFR